jgi:hypothetical protein
MTKVLTSIEIGYPYPNTTWHSNRDIITNALKQRMEWLKGKKSEESWSDYWVDAYNATNELYNQITGGFWDESAT